MEDAHLRAGTAQKALAVREAFAARIAIADRAAAL